MRHIDKIIIKPLSEPRAASSCSSDIDRQELINSYGNEKYLSKWSIDGQDGGTNAASLQINTDNVVREDQAVEPSQNHLPVDDDDGSLVSYNSVRDGGPSKNITCLPYQVQPSSQDITLWQGYSGSIYFDSVRCRPVRINSSKPIKKKSNEKGTSLRVTKSCSPAVEQHTVAGKSLSSCSASSFHSLGSLRISSREEKKKHIPPRTQSQYSKLRKGFIEKTENRQSVHQRSSTTESLVISGGQVISYNDPIDSVYRLNTKLRMSSKSREKSSINSYQNFPMLVRTPSEEKPADDNLICIDNSDGLTRLPGVEQLYHDKKSKGTSEPTPVFIIPFATLDDPVEADLKQEKQNKQEKEVIESENQIEEASTSEVPAELKPVQEELVKPEKLVMPEKPVKPKRPLRCHTSDTSVKQKEKMKDLKPQASSSQPLAAHIINITAVSNVPRVSPRYDFQVRREISNSSLSNYLQTVPKTPKSISIPKEQRNTMPKLSYSQRSQEPKELDIENNYEYRSTNGSSQRTSALYGGYLPSTRPNFYVELRSETASETPVSSPQHYVPKSIVKKVGVKGTEKEQKIGNDKYHLPVIGWSLT